MGILERAFHRNAETLYGRALDHLNGVGVPRSDEEAVRLLRKAAFRGSSRAQALLGWMYYRGTCVPQSYGKAAKCCTALGRKRMIHPSVSTVSTPKSMAARASGMLDLPFPDYHHSLDGRRFTARPRMSHTINE